MIFTPETQHLCIHLSDSYEKFSESPILNTQPENLPQALYSADFILLAHDTQKDPVFSFANLTAQKLWEMDWDEFTSTPSRLSAPENMRAERQTLLDAASDRNIISGFKGIRISKSGKLFYIKNVTLWNIFNNQNLLIGQAAIFSPDQIEYLP